MKHVARILMFSAVSFLFVGAASATTIDSSSSSVNYLGYNSATNTLSNAAPAATFNVPTGGVWAAPVGTSSWVSFNANVYPGGSESSGNPNPDAPNGTYTYDTVITGVAAGSTITLTVMADDTTSVFLNGEAAGDQVLPAAPPVPAAHCTMGTPNCSMLYTFTFALAAGTDTLYFGVDQDFGNATGLDFAGTVNGPVPEPSSLMLLGTGLLGAAGVLRRRIRA